jgi:hypothetical protein
MFKLTVDPGPSLLPIKSNRFIWLDGCPLKNSALPCVIRPGWQRQSESLADLYRSGGKETTAVFSPTILAKLFSRANATIISAALAVWRSTRRLTLP